MSLRYEIYCWGKSHTQSHTQSHTKSHTQSHTLSHTQPYLAPPYFTPVTTTLLHIAYYWIKPSTRQAEISAREGVILRKKWEDVQPYFSRKSQPAHFKTNKTTGKSKNKWHKFVIFLFAQKIPKLFSYYWAASSLFKFRYGIDHVIAISSECVVYHTTW